MPTKQRLPLEKALLGFLTQRPMHGYDLHRLATDRLGRIWHMGISNVYTALKRLQQAGHVESTSIPQENHPPRKIYHITAAGRESFQEWIQQPESSMQHLRVEFLAKLFFFYTLDMQGSADLIAAQERVCQERVARLERSMAECDAQDFDRLVFDFRRSQINAILDWLKSCPTNTKT